MTFFCHWHWDANPNLHHANLLTWWGVQRTNCLDGLKRNTDRVDNLDFFYILNRVSEFSPQSCIEVVRNKAIYYHRNFKPKGTNEVVLSKSSGQKGSGGSQTTLVLSMVSRIALALLRRSVLSFHHPHWGPLSITPFSYKDAIKMPHARPILRHAWVTTSQKNGKSEAHWVLLHLVTIATSLGCLT